MTFSEKVIRFNHLLPATLPLPPGVEVMNPFLTDDVRFLSEQFYQKYYSDHQPRKLILGINPGRLGAGITGIPFTDPVKLKKQCGISNTLRKATEPSAGFVYDVIAAFGGPGAFYSQYFINSVSPLGFVKEGKNYNYYDSKALEDMLEPFIVSSLKTMIDLGVDTDVCHCLGNGKNFKYLQKLNARYHFFDSIIPLPHPRWVVQYRRKSYDAFVNLFLKHLRK